LNAALSADFDGSVNGEASFNDLPFDTEGFISPANISSPRRFPEE